MRIPRKVAAILPLILLFLCGLAPANAASADPAIAISDDFSGPRLNRSIWTTRQISGSRYRFHRQSLEITTLGGDDSCRGVIIRCQRNEIRVRGDLQLPFGTEAWYGFSFRVDGYVDPSDSNRLVIGQWKEQSGGSPFVAQRFDNRVFRVTIQDSECRTVIAEAPSDLGLMHGLLYLNTHKKQCTRASDIKLTPANSVLHILPDPYQAWVHMVYRIRGGRGGGGLVEVWANGECVVRAEGAIGNRDFGGLRQYFKFGVYRDRVPYDTRVRMDNFRRAASHAEIDPDYTPCAHWDG